MRGTVYVSRRGPSDRAPSYPPKIILFAGLLVTTSLVALAYFRPHHKEEPAADVDQRVLETLSADASAALGLVPSPSSATSKEIPQHPSDVTNAIPADAKDDDRISRSYEHQEFQGDAIEWGPANLQPTAQACAGKCLSNTKCNIWVWCGHEQGCSDGDMGKHQACWLKRQGQLDPEKPDGAFERADIRWTSGVVASVLEFREAKAKHEAREQRERDRIKALRDNVSLPLVFLDVEIKGKPIGRMEFVLFTHTSPLAAENFRAICTGERGPSFKGAYFYRIIDRFIDQSGSNDGSVYGGNYNDEPGALSLKHDRPGLLSLANGGPNTNTGHFSIVVAPAPHLNGHYGIFGELVSGADVMYKINALSLGKRDNTAGRDEGALITECGQLRYGTNSAALQAQYPTTAPKLIKKSDELFKPS